VVLDKFHVIKNANEAVDKVRRAEVRLGGKADGQRSTKASGSSARIPST